MEVPMIAQKISNLHQFTKQLFLEQTFETNLLVLFLILGFLTGGRNVWMLAKQEAERQSSHVKKRNQYDL